MSTQILVVDDTPKLETLIRQIFRRQIRNDEYSFHFASDGREAWKIVQTEPAIDVVLTDISLPRMDGPYSKIC